MWAAPRSSRSRWMREAGPARQRRGRRGAATRRRAGRATRVRRRRHVGPARPRATSTTGSTSARTRSAHATGPSAVVHRHLGVRQPGRDRVPGPTHHVHAARTRSPLPRPRPGRSRGPLRGRPPRTGLPVANPRSGAVPVRLRGQHPAAGCTAGSGRAMAAAHDAFRPRAFSPGRDSPPVGPGRESQARQDRGRPPEVVERDALRRLVRVVDGPRTEHDDLVGPARSSAGRSPRRARRPGAVPHSPASSRTSAPPGPGGRPATRLGRRARRAAGSAGARDRAGVARRCCAAGPARRRESSPGTIRRPTVIEQRSGTMLVPTAAADPGRPRRLPSPSAVDRPSRPQPCGLGAEGGDHRRHGVDRVDSPRSRRAECAATPWVVTSTSTSDLSPWTGANSVGSATSTWSTPRSCCSCAQHRNRAAPSRPPASSLTARRRRRVGRGRRPAASSRRAGQQRRRGSPCCRGPRGPTRCPCSMRPSNGGSVMCSTDRVGVDVDHHEPLGATGEERVDVGASGLHLVRDDLARPDPVQVGDEPLRDRGLPEPAPPRGCAGPACSGLTLGTRTRSDTACAIRRTSCSVADDGGAVTRAPARRAARRGRTRPACRCRWCGSSP